MAQVKKILEVEKVKTLESFQELKKDIQNVKLLTDEINQQLIMEKINKQLISTLNTELAGLVARINVQFNEINLIFEDFFKINSGWSVTNKTEDKTLDCLAVALPELANIVGTIIDTLKDKEILSS